MFSTAAMFRSARRHATTGLANKARLNPKEILSHCHSTYQDQEIWLEMFTRKIMYSWYIGIFQIISNIIDFPQNGFGIR